MDLNDIPASRGIRATRSSLACLPCRSRHLKCDGRRPECSRCTESAKHCHYTESRRGGSSRASLAERRSRQAARQSALGNEPSPSSDGLSSTRQDQPVVDREEEQGYSFHLPNLDIDGDLAGLASPATSSTATPTSPFDHNYSIDNDVLIQRFYQDFHRFHPMVVPRRHLIRLYQDPDRQSALIPLIAALRLMGHLFNSQAWSQPLQEFAETCFSQSSAAEPVMVQCRLLYSMSLFWFDRKEEALTEMDSAVQLALDLGMHRQEFAVAHSGGDHILAESWRRTWWWVDIIDAYYVGTLGNRDFAVVNIDATVDLPCSESSYERGVSALPFLL